MPLLGAEAAVKTVKSYCRPSVLIETTEATSKSAPISRLLIVPVKEMGKTKPAALGGIVDCPAPLIISTVLLPKPSKIGAAETTVAPLKIIPDENGMTPPAAPPEGLHRNTFVASPYSAATHPVGPIGLSQRKISASRYAPVCKQENSPLRATRTNRTDRTLCTKTKNVDLQQQTEETT
jgi:hypothetical protein